MKRAVQLALSLAITTACFWWTFKDTRWAEMWASLRSANYYWLLPYALILTAIHICRTLRWGSLLSGLGKVPFKKLNEAAGIGFMMLIILPFRLGEFARPFLLAQRSTIRRSPAMTTVVLERIVDGIVIAVMLRVLLFFVPANGADIRHIRWGANLMFVIFFGGLMFLLFALWQQDRAVRLVRAVAGKLSQRAADQAAHIVDGFVGAMRQLPARRQMAMFVLYTAIYWFLNGWGMSVLARAFDCQMAGTTLCEPLQLSLFQGFVVLAVLVVGLMIPAAPGSAGTFQAFIVLGLSVFLPKAVVNASGVAYANVLWVVQMGQQVLFGLVLLLLSRQSLRDIAGELSDVAEAESEALAAPQPKG